MNENGRQQRMRLILAGILAAAISGCNSHAYHAEATQLADAACKSLVMSGAASSEADCQFRDLVKYEAGGWSLGPVSWGGVTLNIYAVSDPTAIQAVEASIRQARARLGKVKVDLNVFSSKHGEPRVRLAGIQIS